MLNWNEIRTRAQQFVEEWDGETRERGEYQLFWEDFFNVFGIKRRSVALYQKKLKYLGIVAVSLICFGLVCCSLSISRLERI